MAIMKFQRERFFAGLKEFELFCEEQAMEVPARVTVAAMFSATMIQDSIREVFGDKSVLAPLSKWTIDLRDDNDPTRPLLITGQLLRDSVKKMWESSGADAVAGVGSDELVLLYSERGFHNKRTDTMVPPRPAFTIGVYRALPAVKEMVAELLGPGFRFRNLSGRFASVPNLMINPGKLTDAIGEI